MDQFSKIYVAGHCGLVGSALLRQLNMQGYQNLVLRTHAELDLTNQQSVADFFQTEKPEYVFLAAAKVGGIYANSTYPAEFIFSNLSIQMNVIHQSYSVGVKRLLFLGSSCIYPRDCPQPIKEEYLLTGLLEPTNRPYALAKIAGVEMCWSYNRQYGTQYLGVMPTNLYGPGDNYNLNNSHVLPALIRKMHEAKINNDKEVVLWGSGIPKREFMHVSDLANALVFLAKLDSERYGQLVEPSCCPLINVGVGDDLSISELAKMVAEVVEYDGDFVQDFSKPDGTMRKILNSSKMRDLGWVPKFSLREGVARAYLDFKNTNVM
ncbi:WcaG Nucleoside-diphosphate-sugar epimerases [Methylophilaceae bacterium]